MEKIEFSKATISYENCGEKAEVVCTDSNFSRTLNKLKKCSWITNINVEYELGESNKVTKKTCKNFVKKAKEIINLTGATSVKTYEGNNQYILKSNYGNVEINIPEDESATYTIYIEFKEPEKAKDSFDCNKFTGKYNIHMSSLKGALKLFYCTLCDILDKNSLEMIN